MGAHHQLGWYLVLVAVVALERVAELLVARRNTRWSLHRGGVERGRGHYPVMVALHGSLLVGAVVEVVAGRRTVAPALGWCMVALVVAAQALRWWCIRTLGPRWNTRVIVLPGVPAVTTGPYRWLAHPNYAAVAVEGAALPMAHGAWLTAGAFTTANTALMVVRVRCEAAALRHAAAPA